MEKIKIEEVIVVEGRDDTRRINEAVIADTIETNGSAINQETLARIKKAQATRGVIVLTDPDFPGEKIRKTIMAAVPDAKHAFLKVRDAVPKAQGSLGVEHASPEVIQEALAKVYTPKKTAAEPLIPIEILRAAGLLGGASARSRRERLCELLQIGYTNGKQLAKRLEMFQITQADFEKAFAQVLEEEKHD